jgi:hypothetical protein
MACGIFVGHRDGYEGSVEGCFLYDTVTEWAFGPMFESVEECREFLAWLGAEVDPRRFATRELEEHYNRWLTDTGRAT